MITLCLIIVSMLLLILLICSLSDLILLTVAILATEKLFYRFKNRWEKKKQKGAAK